VLGEDVVVQQALPRTDAVGVQLALTEPVKHFLHDIIENKGHRQHGNKTTAVIWIDVLRCSHA
jgi:hypothetical protein